MASATLCVSMWGLLFLYCTQTCSYTLTPCYPTIQDQTCRMWPQLLSRSTHFCSSVGNPSAKVKRLKKRRDREVASNLFVTSDEAPYPRIYLFDFYRSTATAANF